MEVIRGIIDFIINQLLKETPIFMGLIAMVGLILQRKSCRETLEGTIKTVVGLVAFTAGAGILCDAILPVNDIMKPTLSATGTYPFPELAVGVVMGINYVAQAIVPVFIIGWILHLIIVKIFTKYFKAIYLTVHMMINQSVLNIVFWHYAMGLKGPALIIVSALVCAFYWTVSPMLVYPFSKKFLGDDFTLGHFNQLGAVVASLVSPKVGDPETENADNLELPGWLSIFSDMTINLAITMPICFIIIGVIAYVVGNPEAMAAISQNTGGQNMILWLLMKGIAFAAGATILIFGLRMFLAALVPAFKGISEKLIPGAIPALDCAAFYPLSPMGATLGFVGNAIAGILVSAVLLIIGSPLFVYPTLAICFFDGALEGVFGNKFGGWKGAVVSGFIGGLVLHLGVLILNPMTGPLATAGVQFGNFDSSSFYAIFFLIVKTVGNLFGIA